MNFNSTKKILTSKRTIPSKNQNKRKGASRCFLLASKTNPKRIKKVRVSMSNSQKDWSQSQKNNYRMAKKNFLCSNKSGRNWQVNPLQGMDHIGIKSVFKVEILPLICVALEYCRFFNGSSLSKTTKSKTKHIQASKRLCLMEYRKWVSSRFDSYQNNRNLFITDRETCDHWLGLVWLPKELQLNGHLHLQKAKEYIQRRRHFGHACRVVGPKHKKIIC